MIKSHRRTIVEVACALLLLTSFLPGQVLRTSHWAVGALAILFPALYVFNLLVLAVFVLKRKVGPHYAPAATALAVAAGVPLLPRYLSLHGSSKFSNAAKTVKVISANCNYFQHQKPAIRDRISSCVNLLAAQDPIDVLCLQDYSTDGAKNNEWSDQLIKDRLNLPFSYVGFAPSMGIFSRHPIRRAWATCFPGETNGYCAAEIQAERGRFLVYNLHLQSYGFGSCRGPKDIASSLKHGLEMRTRQSQVVANDFFNHPLPTMVVGDFNDVPTSYTYNYFSQLDLQDGFLKVGQGLAATHQTRARIDYILADANWNFSEYHTLPTPSFLDHYWVVAELHLKNPEH